MRIAVWVVDQDPGYMIGTGAPLMKDEVDSMHTRPRYGDFEMIATPSATDTK